MPSPDLHAFSLLPPPYREYRPYHPHEGSGIDSGELRGVALIWWMGRGRLQRDIKVSANRPGGVPLVLVLPEPARLRRIDNQVLRAVEATRPHSGLPYRSCRLSTSTLEASLDEAIRRKIVSATPGGIAITGRLIREAVRSSLSVGERISTHRRLAFALIQLREPTLAAEVASHLLEAGEAFEAAPYVLRGARQAVDTGSWTEARELLESALETTLPARQTGALASLLGRVLRLQGEFAGAEEVWDRAEQTYRTAGDDRRALECRLEGLRANFYRPDRDLGGLRGMVRHL